MPKSPGKSANGKTNSGKDGYLMAGSTKSAATIKGGAPPKVTTSKNMGQIKDAKAGK